MDQVNSYQKTNLVDKLFTASKHTDVVEVRQFVRQTTHALGFKKVDQIRIATAVSEICRNVIDYAKHGSILVKSVILNTRQGILIKVTDSGPGIMDIPQAMQDGFSTRKRLGMGLPGSKRMMDVFGIESEPDTGTKIMMCKWLSQK